MQGNRGVPDHVTMPKDACQITPAHRCHSYVQKMLPTYQEGQ
jgi:hypothetical protein